MKFLAIGNIVKAPSPEQRTQVFTKEVPDTLKLYLEGKIEQFWGRLDKPGVFFLLNAESLDQAKATVNALPLVTQGFCEYEVYPVGPLAPLGMLLQSK